jgi:hypothetical protein
MDFFLDTIFQKSSFLGRRINRRFIQSDMHLELQDIDSIACNRLKVDLFSE